MLLIGSNTEKHTGSSSQACIKTLYGLSMSSSALSDVVELELLSEIPLKSSKEFVASVPIAVRTAGILQAGLRSL